MVSTAVDGPPSVPPPVTPESVRFTVCGPCPTVSLTTGTVNVFRVSPKPNVSVPEVGVYRSPAVAVPSVVA